MLASPCRAKLSRCIHTVSSGISKRRAISGLSTPLSIQSTASA
jgi:hypothetical protein